MSALSAHLLPELGHYALYVWAAVIVTLAVIAVEVLLLVLRRRNILRHLGRTDGGPPR